MASKILPYLALVGIGLATAACQNCQSQDVLSGGSIAVGQAWVALPPNVSNIFCSTGPKHGEACLADGYFEVFYTAGGREHLAVVEGGRVTKIKRYGTVCIDL